MIAKIYINSDNIEEVECEGVVSEGYGLVAFRGEKHAWGYPILRYTNLPVTVDIHKDNRYCSVGRTITGIGDKFDVDFYDATGHKAREWHNCTDLTYINEDAYSFWTGTEWVDVYGRVDIKVKVD